MSGSVVETVASLEDRAAFYLECIDEALAEGDEDSALELQAALERTCAKLDTLRA